MYFYKLKSHQDSLLVDHLKFVGDRGAILIENKSINFKYSKGQLQHTAKVIGYCHDLGKGTKYFQDYLLGKNSVKDKLKAHAFLSSLICFYNVKEINEELAIISYLCVKHHHGNLKNFVDDMYIEDSDKKFVKEQYKALEDEVNTICNELELKLPSLEEIDDLIEKLEDILEEDIIYFSICYEEEVLRPFYEYLKKDEKLNLNFYKDVYGNGLWYLEISHKNASKYHGVQKLRAMLQPDAITGMGDNLNDIPLFEACDRCCAVGNAHKEVKERAEYVLDTNLNAGVVKFLEEEMMS